MLRTKMICEGHQRGFYWEKNGLLRGLRLSPGSSVENKFGNFSKDSEVSLDACYNRGCNGWGKKRLEEQKVNLEQRRVMVCTRTTHFMREKDIISEC